MEKIKYIGNKLSVYMPNTLIFMFVMICLLGVPGSNAFATGSSEVPLYGLYEATIDYQALSGQSHSYSEPFYGVELQAAFTSPSGKTINWWGFFDGDGVGGQSGNIWKIRFMPDELGTWNFNWQFSDGSLSGNGVLTSVDNEIHPRKPGPLRHDPEIHQWLVSADGSQHIFLNTFASAVDGFGASEGVYENPVTAVSTAMSVGASVLGTSGGASHGARDKAINDPLNPFPFMETTDYIPRLQGWHYVETGLWQKMYDNNIYLYEFYGMYGGNAVFDLYSRPTSFQNKVNKYRIARTAPYYFFTYSIGFELSEFVSVPSWPSERAGWIKSIDPWDHLVTAHESIESGFSYKDESNIDYSAMQRYDYSNYHSMALSVWNSPSKPHPHMNEGLWTGSWGSPTSETESRKAQWDAVTGGMSYYYYAKSSTIGYDAFKYVNKFLNSGVKWWKMHPYDEAIVLGKAYVLANPGIEYIAYSSSGNEFTISLPTGNYRWQWFNPSSGNYNDWNRLNHSNGPFIFIKPNANDWVLYIVIDESSDTVPPAAPTDLRVLQ